MEVPERPTLIEMKERLGTLRGGIEKREFLPSKSVPTGIPRGVICEITGTARTAFILDVLVENPMLSTFWAEDQLSILPTALHQRGIDLSRVLMAETGAKLFQTLRRALKSKLFDCVVLPGAADRIQMEVKWLKALQLFARESNACVFFLSQRAKNAWAIPFQLRAQWETDGKTYHSEILKTKFTQTEGA